LQFHVSNFIVFSAQLGLPHKHYTVLGFRQLQAENCKQLFCTTACSLTMDQWSSKQVAAVVLYEGGTKNNRNLKVARELEVVARCNARCRESTQYSSSLLYGVSI